MVLLHGFAGTPRMLRPLGRYLRRRLARPALALPLGLGLGDIRELARRVRRELAERRIGQCDLVGYSMGGLVATYLWKRLDAAGCVRRVITLGTPHRGVPLISRHDALIAVWSRSAHQMRVGSSFLAELDALPAPAGVPMLSIAGASDLLVPPSAARLDDAGAHNRVLQGIDHFRLLTARRVFRCVAEELRDVGEPDAVAAQAAAPGRASAGSIAARSAAPLRPAFVG